MGDPSYTSGLHMWNGTAATLNARPTRTSESPVASKAPLPREKDEKSVDPLAP